MADEQLLDKVHSLSDLELAALLCLVAREHCLISTEPDSVDELAEELRLIASKTFKLSSALVNCHARTTLDEFATALLVPPAPTSPSPTNTRSVSPYRPRHEHPQSSTGGPSSASGSYFPVSPSPRIGGPISPSLPSLGTSANNSHTSQQPRIANVILAKDLDRAPRAVQIQALELLRTRRIFTRTSVQTAPKQFLFIALVGAASGGQARVTPHLNNFLYLAHWHNPEDGFPHLDEELSQRDVDNEELDDGASIASSHSVVKRHSSLGTGTGTGTGLGLGIAESSSSSKWLSPHGSSIATAATTANSPKPVALSPAKSPPAPARAPSSSPSPSASPPLITEADLSHLALLSQQAHASVDVTRYQHNLATFLRLHRAAAGDGGGATPAATRHLERLSRALAPLHGLDHVTPSLVALAARKVYLHRVEVVASARRERSMQWGSDEAAVRGMLEGVGAEDVVEEVLGLVAVPV